MAAKENMKKKEKENEKGAKSLVWRRNQR